MKKSLDLSEVQDKQFLVKEELFPVKLRSNSWPL